MDAESKREYMRAYRARNSSKILAQKRAWNAANAERINAKRSERNKENREKHLSRRRKYYAEHKEIILSQQRSYNRNNIDAITKRRRQDRQDNPEKYRQWAINRKSSPHLAEWKRKHQKKWRAANKEKVAAHCAVRYAVKSGKITKPERCAHCGKATRLHGHHHFGYASEHFLDVTWLCDRCHKLEHSR